MSLDVTLYKDDMELVVEKLCGIEDNNELYSDNITHNLNRMAMEAGIYEHLWRPDEINITHAHQLIEPLEHGLKLLKGDPKRFQEFNSPNGWGLYEHFVPFVRNYLRACKEYPNARVEVSR